MKKLLLLISLTLFSLGSMAMGFPHNSYTQQKSLTSSIKKATPKTPMQVIEVKITDTFEQLNDVEADMPNSLVEMMVNYVVDFFSEKIFDHKTVISTENLEKCRMECVAVKKDFEYYLIG